MKIKIGIFGKKALPLAGYLKYLKEYGETTITYADPDEDIKDFSGLIFLDKPSEKHLKKAAEENIPILLEAPFSDTFLREVLVLKELTRQKAVVTLPLLLRHSPKLLRLRSIITSKILGEVFSIHITWSAGERLLREEPTRDMGVPGKLAHQLVNAVDYLALLNAHDISPVRTWLIRDKALSIEATTGGTLVSMFCSNCPSSSGGDAEICIEAVGSEKMLVWDGTEMSLILTGERVEALFWGMDPDELIARSFLESIKDHRLVDVESMAKSYEKSLELLQSLKSRVRRG